MVHNLDAVVTQRCSASSAFTMPQKLGNEATLPGCPVAKTKLLFSYVHVHGKFDQRTLSTASVRIPSHRKSTKQCIEYINANS